MVIVVPLEPAMSPGKVASQAAHAAMIAGLKSQTHEGFVSWMLGGMKKIVLECSDSLDLAGYAGDANRAGLVTHLVVDEGFTEIPFGTATALAIGPANEGLIDNVTGELELYGTKARKTAERKAKKAKK